MVKIQAMLDAASAQLDKHSFLATLDESSSIEDLQLFAPQMYFFVFGFQDMLRSAREVIQDPKLKEIARKLEQEDAGHQEWYLHDLRQMECEPSAPWVFGEEHWATRDMVYRLMSELHRANDDVVRLVFPLVLESAASVFFHRVVSLLSRSNYKKPLRYFAGMHLDAESDHDIYSDDEQKELEEVAFSDQQLAEAKGLIDRCFACFHAFADHLERMSHTRA